MANLSAPSWPTEHILWKPPLGTLLCASPIEAEAKALLEALKLAQGLHCPITVCSDCLTLVTALQNPLLVLPCKCSALLSVMSGILSSCPLIKVKFIGRSLNTRADWMARSLLNHSLPSDWVVVLDLISEFLE
ncbi:unnamed protein product [Linum trigynum]|uniref:RNase H type-1 domain-containing protein n=1 Tax=Linum trigynum TaxID=586398 RepID=A0AAV2GTG5_9ROSI